MSYTKDAQAAKDAAEKAESSFVSLMGAMAESRHRAFERQRRRQIVSDVQAWILTAAALVWIAWAVTWWCRQ